MIHNAYQRDIDFGRACRRARRELYAEGAHLTPLAIVTRALQYGAPQYYITHRRAEMQLTEYRHNRLSAATRLNTWLLLDELSARVDALLASGQARTVTDALAMVLCSGGASRFFMTPGYALRCYYRICA